MDNLGSGNKKQAVKKGAGVSIEPPLLKDKILENATFLKNNKQHLGITTLDYILYADDGMNQGFSLFPSLKKVLTDTKKLALEDKGSVDAMVIKELERLSMQDPIAQDKNTHIDMNEHVFDDPGLGRLRCLSRVVHHGFGDQLPELAHPAENKEFIAWPKLIDKKETEAHFKQTEKIEDKV